VGSMALTRCRLGRLGGVWPISQAGKAVATVTISGVSFDLYTGYNGSMRVYSFVRAGTSDVKNFKSDIKLFFNYLQQNQQFPASTQNLIGGWKLRLERERYSANALSVYQVGSEAFTGGPAKFSVSSFSASVGL
jgi:xyloglucan-specific endo-beta-1,4-glucanase